MNNKNEKKDLRLLSNGSIFENRSVLFWGFNRNHIKKTSLYKKFHANDRSISFAKDNYVLVVKNELLTQSHKDVLEALLILRNVSSISSVISHYSILRLLQKNSRNVMWLYSILEELNNVNFRYYVKNPKTDGIMADGFRIISDLAFDEDSGQIILSLDKSFLALYANAKVFNYSHFTPLIANLKHDISKQVVRWLLTFDNLQINIKNLLSFKLGLVNVVTSRTINRYISFLKKEDLSMFGIFIEGDNICISRNKDISFFNGSAVGKIKGIRKVKLLQSSLPLFDLD